MSKEHVPFPDLEFDGPVDEGHLQHCHECRENWAIFRFLGFQVRSVPRLKAPPFFASRVAALARQSRVSFAFFLQRAAQQLVPIFVAFIAATGFLLFKMAQPVAPAYHSEILFEEPVQEDFSLEYVVNSLTEVSEEETEP